ncbi:MAG: GNAT family N-acetyltransferase [Spirosomataceae bacterium]
MTTLLREATQEDSPAIIQMMSDFFSLFQYPFDRQERENQVQQILDHPSWGQIWMCCQENQEVIGYQFIAFTYSFEFKGRVAYLDEYFIKEEFRGQGIGQKYLAALVDKYKQLEFGSVRLEIESYNQRAYYLYEKMGFKLHGTRHLMTKFL